MHCQQCKSKLQLWSDSSMCFPFSAASLYWPPPPIPVTRVSDMIVWGNLNDPPHAPTRVSSNLQLRTRSTMRFLSSAHQHSLSHTHTAHQHSWHLSTVQPLSSAHIAGSQHTQQASELEKAGRISPLPQSSGEWKPGEFVKMCSSYFTETCAQCRWTTSQLSCSAAAWGKSQEFCCLCPQLLHNS